MSVTLADVREAQARIAGHVRRTSIRYSSHLSNAAGHDVFLKLETMQDTGAFKIRGATNALLSMPKETRARGVATMSSGNHGRGLAYASQKLGIPCTVFMSELVPSGKVDAIRALGADVVIAGPSQDTADAACRAHVEKEHVAYVHPFDERAVIAGQGTVGLEILEDMPDCTAVLVPLSGGGLFGGVALAMKSLKPDVQAIGITMENGPAMIDSLQAGKPVPVDEEETLADALGGTIGLDNQLTFDLCRRHLDAWILLSETEIERAIRDLFVHDRLVVEGGGAVGAGAVTTGKFSAAKGPTVVVISGCNINTDVFLRIVSAPPS